MATLFGIGPNGTNVVLSVILLRMVLSMIDTTQAILQEIEKMSVQVQDLRMVSEGLAVGVSEINNRLLQLATLIRNQSPNLPPDDLAIISQIRDQMITSSLSITSALEAVKDLPVPQPLD